jgi:DNA-binding FadR family transcriptional regulator
LLLKRQRLYPSLDQAAPIHAPIVQAIKAGNSDQAEVEARYHVSQAAQKLGIIDSSEPQAAR